MTDLETIKAMVGNRNIAYTEAQDREWTTLTFDPDHGFGYSGFVAVLYFKDDGSLYKIGAWE